MPKIKTRRAAAKRFKVTKGGKVMRRSSRLRHLLEWKSAKQRRRLKIEKEVSPTDKPRVLTMLAGGSNG
jgi:large subunit ribosomal protein L35